MRSGARATLKSGSPRARREKNPGWLGRISVPAGTLVFLLASPASATADWWKLSSAERTVETDVLRYGYGSINVGAGIRQFELTATGDSFAFPYESCGVGYAKYEVSSAALGDPVEQEGVLTIPVTRQHLKKTDRLFRGRPVLASYYSDVRCIWIEDKIRVGSGGDRTFVMHGLGALSHSEWKRAHDQAVSNPREKGQPFGDYFIPAAGGTVEGCFYEGHFVYGFVDKATGKGVGFAVQLDARHVRDWKIWDDGGNTWAVEIFYWGSGARRFVYHVTGGSDEVLALGKALVDGTIGPAPPASLPAPDAGAPMPDPTPSGPPDAGGPSARNDADLAHDARTDARTEERHDASAVLPESDAGVSVSSGGLDATPAPSAPAPGVAHDGGTAPTTPHPVSERPSPPADADAGPAASLDGPASGHAGAATSAATGETQTGCSCRAIGGGAGASAPAPLLFVLVAVGIAIRRRPRPG
jgi:hypothetical protein